MESPLHITPFSIHIEAEILSDLRLRIHKTRWPDQAPGAAWEQGADLEYIRQLLAYWANEFDWQAQEREIGLPEATPTIRDPQRCTPIAL